MRATCRDRGSPRRAHGPCWLVFRAFADGVVLPAVDKQSSNDAGWSPEVTPETWRATIGPDERNHLLSTKSAMNRRRPAPTFTNSPPIRPPAARGCPACQPSGPAVGVRQQAVRRAVRRLVPHRTAGPAPPLQRPLRRPGTRGGGHLV